MSILGRRALQCPQRKFLNFLYKSAADNDLLSSNLDRFSIFTFPNAPEWKNKAIVVSKFGSVKFSNCRFGMATYFFFFRFTDFHLKIIASGLTAGHLQLRCSAVITYCLPAPLMHNAFTLTPQERLYFHPNRRALSLSPCLKAGFSGRSLKANKVLIELWALIISLFQKL